ncbi:TonB-dependent receptor [Pseudoduganella namucuonensis]|uniref:Iron complex outermembrane recepter protein n=1 Tax=Pseudoduganella namucuonensis TaxID=1035707 RepID=A0A1I7H0C1_9BURK|nr:TonB-dependent receptor [Pseudoduganella namucuonensis]SFU54127.1 iron complex outermembrane recepter protein [Pseudoduganella namucuonensis]
MHNPKLTLLARALLAAGYLTGAATAMAQNAETKKDGGIAEVIITAQKVAQPASKTPLALSVMSGEDLKNAGTTDPRSLAEMLPNVEIAQESGMLQVSIRGVTSLDMTEKGDPSAAFHVDGAYVPRYEAQAVAFFDLDRIEVLRGPQGTLYGRNATAGAINLITNKPGKTLAGKVGVEIGNYNTRRLDAMINVPMGEVWAMRAAVNTNKHDTYLNPGPNTIALESQDDQSARLHLLGTFSPTTSLLLTAESSKISGGAASPVPITNFFTGTLIGTLGFSPAGTGNHIKDPVYVDRGRDAQRTAGLAFKQDANSHRDNQADSLRGEFKTRLGAVDLTYQLASMRLRLDQLNNGIYFGFPFTTLNRGSSSALSHELRVNSTGNGPLRWVAGVYAFDEDIDREAAYTTYITAPFGKFNVVLPFMATLANKSKAAFGQATYALRDDTRLTLGVRGTRDRKTGYDPLSGEAAKPPATTSSKAYSQDVEFSNTSWKVGLDHDLRRNVMLYASVSTGYKSGGFNAEADTGVYKPETLTAYEAGVKGRFLDNHLQLSANVFHYAYKDQQLTTTTCRTNDPSTCHSFTANAANSTVDGLEFEGKLKVGDDGMLRGTWAVTDAKFKKYNPSATIDFSGQKLDRAPTSTIGLGYTHRFALANGGEVAATVATRHSTSYYISDPTEGIRYRQPSYHKSDASIGYESPNGTWNVQLFVKNIEDMVKIESRVPGSFFISDPRTFGVRAGYNF